MKPLRRAPSAAAQAVIGKGMIALDMVAEIPDQAGG
jgi:hypothetical protein